MRARGALDVRKDKSYERERKIERFKSDFKYKLDY